MTSLPCPGQLPLFPTTKRCSKCASMKPLDAFGKHPKARDGHQSNCNACGALHKKMKRATNPEKEREIKRRYLATHPEQMELHRQRVREWHEEHREEVNTAKRVDRIANPEKYRAQDRRKRTLHLDACKARDRAYYAAHRERRLAYCAQWRAQRRDTVREASRQYYWEHWTDQRSRQAAYYETHREEIAVRMYTWVRSNRARLKVLTHRRRARLAQVGGSWTAAEWEAVKASYDYRCLRCRQQEPTIKLVFDHVIPISRGGRNDIANCQPLCGRCNSVKRQRTTDYRTH